MTKQNYDHEVTRGLVYNLLGVLGKAFNPIFFIVVGRMYGADALGVYLLVFVFIEMLKKLAVGGLNDGVMIFAARYLARRDERNAYQALANSIVLCAGVGLLLCLALLLGASGALPMYSEGRIQSLLRLMAPGLPLQAAAVLLVSATKAHAEMKWDALLQGCIRPFGLFVCALLFAALDFGVDGLGYGYTATSAVMFAAALVIFCRSFSMKRLLLAFRRFRFMRPLLVFVLPQSLNLTFTDMIAGFDVMMLGFFGVQPALIGYYGIAAQIVHNIEQVRLAFSGAYTPVIARLYGEQRPDEMNVSYNKVSRWTMLLAFPLGFLVIFFRHELLQLFHPAFGVPFALPMNALLPGALISVLRLEYLGDMGATGFMILLTLVPLLSCGIGLAGNVITALGKSAWSLANSVTVAGLSFLFAALFIPVYGLFGAALAAVLAAVSIRLIQIMEARFLLGVRLRRREVYKPYIAALVSGALLLFADISDLGYFWLKLPAIILILGVYFGILKCLGFEEGDARVLMLWKKRKE
ncbi:MAG: polysaccharide biosynthesis C-terminal domain-containing protein [Spirochaetota bacterium]|nr:polysaccharide biosynthesis C-terminal domain-containing protein [Spirochaetota bacterium]